MNAVAELPAPLVFTDNAANKVKELINEEGNEELKLRVFVTGGGCSGFQYGFTFRRGNQRRRYRHAKKRRDAVNRSDELSIFNRCGNRLPRKSGRFAVRD